MIASRTAGFVFASLALLGCESAPISDPTLPPLDPLRRESTLTWSVSQAQTLGPAGLALLDALRPDGLMLVGSAARSESAPSTFDAVASLPLRLGLASPLLPAGLSEACFDPSDPLADPALVAHRDALVELLDLRPDLQDLALDLRAGAPFWEVECSCVPCSEGDLDPLRTRLRVAWDLLAPEASERSRQAWWWHAVPETAEEGAPAQEPLAPREALDAELLTLPAGVPVWLGATTGPDRAYAAADPAGSVAGLRRVRGTLDLAGARFGPTDALLLRGAEHVARMREDRQAGVTGWFLAMDGAGRSVPGTLEELDAVVVDKVFRDNGLPATQALEQALAERYALGVDDAAMLARALGETGRAYDVATNPHGVPVADLALGTPAALPLRWEDPSLLEPAWAERVQDLASANDRALLQVHQWAMEAEAMSARALAVLAVTEDSLPPSDVAILRRRLRVLDFAVRAWGRYAMADVTLRALEVGGSSAADGQLRAWLAEDAATLEALASEVQAAVASGEVPDPFPVVSDSLLAVAGQLAVAAADATPSPRAFPVLFQLSYTTDGGEIRWTWGLDPQGPGWLERGPRWPVYDASSEFGEGPASAWEANRTDVPPATKMTWRACTETEGQIAICSSDRVLWSPP